MCQGGPSLALCPLVDRQQGVGRGEIVRCRREEGSTGCCSMMNPILQDTESCLGMAAAATTSFHGCSRQTMAAAPPHFHSFFLSLPLSQEGTTKRFLPCEWHPRGVIPRFSLSQFVIHSLLKFAIKTIGNCIFNIFYYEDGIPTSGFNLSSTNI